MYYAQPHPRTSRPSLSAKKKKDKPSYADMSALIWVVMTILCAVSLAKDCGSGFQVRSCSGDDKVGSIIGELEYGK